MSNWLCRLHLHSWRLSNAKFFGEDGCVWRMRYCMRCGLVRPWHLLSKPGDVLEPLVPKEWNFKKNGRKQ